MKDENGMFDKKEINKLIIRGKFLNANTMILYNIMVELRMRREQEW